MTDYKAIRNELGLTQKDLGELLGIDPTQISKAENGHEVPAMYEYALKGLLAENASESAPPDGKTYTEEEYTALQQKLLDRNSELIEANNKILELKEAKPAPTAQTPEQPQPRRGLGRPKNAARRD